MVKNPLWPGTFKARHTSLCTANNAAGSSLNDQLVQLDTHILMNTPHVSTTVHDTVIDLSLVSNEMAANTYWSIYPVLVSDHLAVMLTIVNTRLPDSTTRPKRWLLELADRDTYIDGLQDRSAEMEWHGDLEVNQQQLVAVILQAAEIAIPYLLLNGERCKRGPRKKNFFITMGRFALHK